MMVPECCIWYDERCWDDTPSNKSLVDVVNYGKKIGSETGKFILSLYDRAQPQINNQSPFLELTRHYVNRVRKPRIEVSDPDPEYSKKQLERSSTIAEKIGIEGRADVYRIFYLGGIIRMLDYELTQKEAGNAVLENCRKEANSKLKEWNEIIEKKYNCKTFPIRNLIGMNLGSILYSTEYVKWRKMWKN